VRVAGIDAIPTPPEGLQGDLILQAGGCATHTAADVTGCGRAKKAGRKQVLLFVACGDSTSSCRWRSARADPLGPAAKCRRRLRSANT
jgi:hypothetical protein